MSPSILIGPANIDMAKENPIRAKEALPMVLTFLDKPSMALIRINKLPPIATKDLATSSNDIEPI